AVSGSRRRPWPALRMMAFMAESAWSCDAACVRGGATLARKAVFRAHRRRARGAASTRRFPRRRGALRETAVPFRQITQGILDIVGRLHEPQDPGIEAAPGPVHWAVDIDEQ